MLKASSYAALAVIGVCCVDAGGRMLLRGSTSFKFIQSTTLNSRVLFVHFPGILTGRTSTGVVSVWKHFGDVLLVEYRGKRFNGDKAASDVAAQLHMMASKYDYVVFIGSSMGGLVAYDTYQLLPKDSGTDYRFVQIDSPTRRADLQSPLNLISLGSYLWWAGPLSNPFSSLYFRLTFVKPKEENIELGVDHAKLMEYVNHQMSHPLSWAMDQNRYIINHDPVMPGSLAGVRLVYVRSTRDIDTVRPEAFDVWNAANNGAAIRMEVDSTHVGYVERPQTWYEGFGRAIELVLH